jgi:hypothetical protein
MSPLVLRVLREQRFSLCRRWEALLRVEPVNTPLAIPDALTHLIPDSVESILHELTKPGSGRLTLNDARGIKLPVCGCNRNPYLAHFRAGEQAFLETVVLIQVDIPHAERRQEDLADVVRAVRALAGSEIDTFCSLCTQNGESPGCRFHESTGTAG